MIKLKNVDEYVVEMKKPGSLAAATDIANAVVPFASTLKAIFVRVGAAGTKPGDANTNVAVDVNKNGTTILTTSKVTFDGSSVAPSSYGAFATNPPTFAKGDVISFDIDSVFNGTGPTQPKNLSVLLVLQRGRGSKVAAVETDTVGPEAE